MAKDDQMNAEELAKAYREANEDAKSFAQTMSGIMAKQGIMGEEAKLYRDFTKEVADGMKENLDAAGQLQVLEQARTQLMQKLAQAGLQVNKQFAKMADLTKKVLENTEEVESKTKTLKDLEKERKEEIESLNKEFGVFGKSFQEYTDLARDPKMMGVVAMGLLLKEIGAVGAASRELVKSIGAVNGQAIEVTAQVTETTAKFRMMGVDAQEAAAAVGAIYMNTTLTGDEMDAAIDKVAVLTEGFGMSAEQAAEMTEQASMAGLNVDDMAISLARARGVAPAKVLSQMSGSMDEIARFGKEGAKNFVEAAAGAAQLGIEVGSVVSAGRSLLDVESSIEKQMEAEVLLGKKLNLERARSAALAGDQATVMEEILKNVGSIEELQSMNVLEQEALAGALGMSVPELLKMAENQEKIAGLSEEAKEHFAATGEILEENNSLSEAAKQTMTQFGIAIAQAVAQAAALKAMNKFLGGGAAQPGKTTAAAPKAPATPKGGVSDMGVSKVGKNMKNIVAGAAAMILVAAAVFVFAKAVQEFMKVNWGAIAMAVVSMLALVGAVALIGAIMMSGVGALAIIAGAAAMLIVAAAVLVLAAALYVMSLAIPNFLLLIDVLPQLAIGMMMMYPAIPAMMLMGYALIPLGIGLLFAALGTLAFTAAGGPEALIALGLSLPLVAQTNPLALAAIGYSMLAFGFGLMFLALGLAVLSPFVGTLFVLGMTLPIITTELTALAGLAGVLPSIALGIGSIALSILGLAASLLFLTPMLPTLMLLGGVLAAAQAVFGGEEGGGGEGDTQTQILNKLDELIAAVKAGGTINMDGQKVGEVIGLSGAGGMD